MEQKVQQTAGISRRSLGRMIMAWLAGGAALRRVCASNAPLLAVDQFMEGLTGAPARKTSFTYRADAVVVLLSLPIYRREGVGSGFASIAEAMQEDGRYYALRFAGASRPDRAAGLDRMGVIREVVRERNAALSDAAYFGVLTSSPEETLEDGRRSLNKGGEKWNDYSAIDGKSSCGYTRSAVTHFRLPSAGDPNVRVIKEARTNFQTNPPSWHENQWPVRPECPAPPTFLYALMRALRLPQRTTDSWYVYSERSYRLHLEKQPDRQQGRRFAELGLTAQPERVVEVRGRTRDEHSGRQTNFRLWIEDGSANALPMRIEFQPRSYLRLSFEVDPRASTTTLEEEL